MQKQGSKENYATVRTEIILPLCETYASSVKLTVCAKNLFCHFRNNFC
jgi:hypothetical protein